MSDKHGLITLQYYTTLDIQDSVLYDRWSDVHDGVQPSWGKVHHAGGFAGPQEPAK